jgi:hypothetical protein
MLPDCDFQPIMGFVFQHVLAFWLGLGVQVANLCSRVFWPLATDLKDIESALLVHQFNLFLRQRVRVSEAMEVMPVKMDARKAWLVTNWTMLVTILYIIVTDLIHHGIDNHQSFVTISFDNYWIPNYIVNIDAYTRSIVSGNNHVARVPTEIYRICIVHPSFGIRP